MGENIIEKRAGLGVFANFAVLHGKRDTGIRVVRLVALTAIRKHRSIRHLVEGLLVFVHRLLEVSLGISFAAFGKKLITLGHSVLAADHFTLGKAAVTISTFSGIRHGDDDRHSGCRGHQRDGGATRSIHWRFLHGKLRVSGDVFEIWEAIF